MREEPFDFPLFVKRWSKLHLITFAMERVSDRQRATLAGLYSVTWSIGYSIGPAVAGWLQTSISLSASFVYGAVCLLVAPSLLLIFFGKKRTSKSVTQRLMIGQP